ncbi:MAG TPA: NAD(P)H-hydrate dehydratase [bacterium]
MRLLTTKEMQKIDGWAKKALGIAGAVLMENAGRGCTEVLKEYFRLRGLKVLIVCGQGNNGGDGLVMARHLTNAGSRVEVLLLGKGREFKGEALINYRTAKAASISIREISSVRVARRLCNDFKPDCIVDAIFGTGFRGAPKGIFLDVIELINTCGGFVFSVDIPSGIDGNTGGCEKACVHADATATMCLPKRGNFLYPGRGFAGDLHVVDIGIPYSMIDPGYPRVAGHEDIFKIMPSRLPDGNKGTFGNVLVIAGARGFSGAAAMSALSALKIGAGYVRLAAPEVVIDKLDPKLLEVVKVPLAQTAEGTISSRAFAKLAPLLDKTDVVVVGPGITTHPETADFLFQLLPRVKVPLIIDADAINIIAKKLAVLKTIRTPFTMTPHPGELSRLIKQDTRLINHDRIDVAAKYARRFGAVMVLKGVPTAIASPQSEVYVNPTGNSGLAKAGTGDVLVGMIAGLCAQKVPLFYASVAGVFLHGLCADLLLDTMGKYSIMAGDLIRYLPKAIRYIVNREYEKKQA